MTQVAIKKPENGYTSAFDTTTRECERCGSARHYHGCTVCKKRLSCAGFATKDKQTRCCVCGEVK